MLGAVEKNFWQKNLKKDPKDLIVVTIMPCTAKKYETDRNELNVFFHYKIFYIEKLSYFLTIESIYIFEA